MTLSLLQHLYRPHQLEWESHSRQRSEGLEKLPRQEVQSLLGARRHDDLFRRTTYSAGVAHIFRDGSSQRWITTCITLPIQRTRCFAINARRNPRPQFDWKQVDSRLVAPKRVTDGMRSWQ